MAELGDRGRKAFRAAASGLVGAEMREGAAEAVAPLLAALAPADQRLLGALLLGLEYGGPILSGRPSRLSSLDLEERTEVLRGWAESRLAVRRQAAAALKALAMLAHYGRADAWAEVEYDGPWLGRIPVPVLPAPALPERRADEETAAGLVRGRDAVTDLRLRAEACVIGTGAGGAAALARLAALGVDAVAVEAGGHVTASDFTQRELEMLPLLYQQAGLRSTADKAIGILQGKGVGGSTLHNTGLVYAPPPGIIGRWREEHGFEFDDAELERHTAWATESLGAVPIPHERVNANNDALRRGADALGWRYRVADHNRAECCGCGYCMLGCAYNRKNNAALTFLPRAVADGTRILSDARVIRIEGRAGARRIVCELLGGDGRPTGRRAVVEAETVFMAAGALDTPALLQRSGLGNDRVGRRLRLHPAPLVSGVFSEPVVAWRGLPQSVIVEEFASFMDNGRGGFLFVPSASNWPGLTAAVLPGLGAEHRARMADYPRLASAAVLLHDETEGRVRAARDGVPVATYWPEKADLEELRCGVAALARAYFAAGAERVILPYADAPEVQSEAELEAVLGRARSEPHRLSLNSVHPQGSCPLGDDPRRSACRPDGRLWGEDDVFVCDTSLFPTSVGVPPQVTTMALAAAVAECAAAGRPRARRI